MELNRLGSLKQLKSLCRCCLTRKGNLEITSNLQNMIEFCLNVMVEDTSPQFVCKTCNRLILQFGSFKRDVQRKDKILKKTLSSYYKIDNVDSGKQPEIRDPSNNNVLREIDSCYFSKCDTVRLKINNTEIQFQSLDQPPPLVPISTDISRNDCATNINIPRINQPPPLIPLVATPNFIVETMENANISTANQNKEHCLSQSKTDLQCTACQSKFNHRKALLKHLRGHQIQKDHACKICGKKYSYPSHLTVHMREHSGERPFKCHMCGKGFKRWANVTNHLKTHSLESPYSCQTCGQNFKYLQNLKRHKILHSSSLPYCCGPCGKNFTQFSSLAYHLQSIHSGDRPFLCDYCGKTFVLKSMLTRHARIHTGFKPYKCKYCAKAYANKIDLRRHGRVHNKGEIISETKKKYSCLVCNVRFYHPCRLERHKGSYKHRKREAEIM